MRARARMNWPRPQNPSTAISKAIRPRGRANVAFQPIVVSRSTETVNLAGVYRSLCTIGRFQIEIIRVMR